MYTHVVLPNASDANQNIKVVVISVGSSVTMNEVFFNANDRVPAVRAYDSRTRQNLNVSGQSAWLWVTLDDVTRGSAQLGAENRTLVASTPTEWIFQASHPGGNSSAYHFSRTTQVLTSALGYFSGSNLNGTATVTLLATGVGGQNFEYPVLVNRSSTPYTTNPAAQLRRVLV